MSMATGMCSCGRAMTACGRTRRGCAPRCSRAASALRSTTASPNPAWTYVGPSAAGDPTILMALTPVCVETAVIASKLRLVCIATLHM